MGQLMDKKCFLKMLDEKINSINLEMRVAIAKKEMLYDLKTAVETDNWGNWGKRDV